MRLDQFVSHCSDFSRKDAKRTITRGRVSVNNTVCTRANTQLQSHDTVTLDGNLLALATERYLMLHKPAGVISATRDSEQPIVLDLLPAEVRDNLHVAGRLDADTTGLVLLTSDGQWSHRVTSPRSGCLKTYQVELAQAITADAIAALEQGVQLHNEAKLTLPASVTVLAPQRIELTLSEGRYHQVKRMLAAVGNHVTALHRSRIGALELDPALGPGQFRELTPAEIASFN